MINVRVTSQWPTHGDERISCCCEVRLACWWITHECGEVEDKASGTVEK